MGRNTLVSTVSIHLVAAAVALAGGGGGNGQPPKDPVPVTVIDDDIGPPAETAPVATPGLTRSQRDAMRGVPLPETEGGLVPEAPPVMPEQVAPVATKVVGQLVLRDGRLMVEPARGTKHEVRLGESDTPALRALIQERIGRGGPVEVSGTVAGVNTLDATRFAALETNPPRAIVHTSQAGGPRKGKASSTRGLRIGDLLVDSKTSGDLVATLNGNIDKEVSAEGWLLRMGETDRAIIPTRVSATPVESSVAVVASPVEVTPAALLETDAAALTGGQRRGGMGNTLEASIIPESSTAVVASPVEVVTPVVETETQAVVPATTIVDQPLGEETAVVQPTHVVDQSTVATVATPTEVVEETEEPQVAATPSKVKFESGYLYDLVQKLNAELPAAEKSKGHAITVPMVMLANGLKPGSVVSPKRGRELTIPAAAPLEALVVKDAAGKPQHWVQDGERMTTIARRYGTSVAKLMELNPTVAARIQAKGVAGLRANDLLVLPEGAKLEGTRDVTPAAGAR